MYAIVKTGGKQYRVEAGRTLEVERLPQGEGETVELGEVLMIAADGNVTIGTPMIDGARVLASVESHGKAPKIVVYKYKNKVRTRKKTGHRQRFTRLTVEQILMPGEEAKAAKPKARKAQAEADEFVPADGSLDTTEEAAEAIIAAGEGPAKAKTGDAKPKATKAATKSTPAQDEPVETFEPEDGNLDTEDEAAEAIVAAGAKAPKAPAKPKAEKAPAKPKAEKAPAKATAKGKAAKEEDKPKPTRRRLPLGRKKKETE
ncbi:MAG TPA: 50S ribosomal protein L21 [Dehalococcoidia bacterium]|jgi:large subunit ribosomal protein L21